MIFVPRGDEPSKDWLKKAEALTKKLRDAKDTAARNAIIDANDGLWGEIKDFLLKKSHGKCWFSEARDCFQHWDVEHFRPKKEAFDETGKISREGYWWLAFDWTNYRICGRVGNVRKGTQFPIKRGARPAASTDPNVDDELNVLLDPSCEGDPAHLSFEDDGSAVSMPGLRGWGLERAEYSIPRLNLNFGCLKEERRRVWTRCFQKVNECQNLLTSESGTATTREGIKRLAHDIRDMTRSDYPLSAVATECLRKQNLPLVQRLVAAIP